MIKGYYLENNEVKTDGLETFSQVSNLIWVDISHPTVVELKEISDKTGITISELEQGVDEDERPRINLSDGYAQIILSTPDHTRRGVETVSFSIFLFKNKIITLRKKEHDVISNIANSPKHRMVEILNSDPTNMLSLILQDIITDYFRVTDPIEDVIEKIDEELFHEFDDKKIVKKIFRVRKTLIYFHKALVANREVLAGIEAKYPPQIKGSSVNKFRFLHNDVTQLIDMVTAYREIISGSLEVYMTSVSNNLNQVMKRLTVYASFVMVPTLISGIYGMNFQFMPELGLKYGYFFALGLMAISIIVMHIMFKKKGWI